MWLPGGTVGGGSVGLSSRLHRSVSSQQTMMLLASDRSSHLLTAYRVRVHLKTTETYCSFFGFFFFVFVCFFFWHRFLGNATSCSRPQQVSRLCVECALLNALKKLRPLLKEFLGTGMDVPVEASLAAVLKHSVGGETATAFLRRTRLVPGAVHTLTRVTVA